MLAPIDRLLPLIEQRGLALNSFLRTREFIRSAEPENTRYQ